MKETLVARTDDDKDLDRRNFLKCMAWVGTGAVWTLSSGVLKGSALGQISRASMMPHGNGGLRFVQISDSHIGFDKPANADVTARGLTVDFTAANKVYDATVSATITGCTLTGILSPDTVNCESVLPESSAISP